MLGKKDIAESVSSLSESQDASILTDHYNEVLTSVLDKHAPAKVKTITVRPKQPWFSDKLYQAKCEKRKEWRRTNLTIHYYLYHAKKTEYNHLLASAKKQHYNTRIVESGHDSNAILG